jgi:outer membrane receptor protein involved in Fe transport
VFLQSGDLNAREPISDTSDRPPLFRYRIGASRGDALVKDRTFYYAAFEQEHIRTEDSSDIDPLLADQINGFVATGAFPRMTTRQITTGFFPVALSETEASAKLNHQLTPRNSLMFRYAFTNNKDAGEGFNTSGLTDVSARGSNFTEDNGLVGSLTSLFGSNAVNDLRFQLARRSVTLRTNDQVGPSVDIDGLLSFGRPYAGNSHHREYHSELTDTFARTSGSHLYKLGATVNHVDISSFAPDGSGGVYIFPSVGDFLNGAPDTFLQAFGNPQTAFSVTNYGAFLQDHWSLTKQATIDLGLRYDFEHLPPGFNEDIHNFSPRLGLAYSPSNRWVVRTGYGIFFDRYILANLNRAIETNGLQGFQQVADGPVAASIFAQSQGGSLAEPLSGIQPSIFKPDPHVATRYSQQANLGIQFLLSKNLTASADYLFVRGVKLARTRNVNLLPPIILTPQNSASLGIPDPAPQQIGREVFGPGRIDPAFDAMNLIEDSASSTYHGLSFSVNRQIEDFTVSASYTLSKATDDASDFTEQPQNPFDLRSERALSLNDQPQRFVLSGLFDLPFGDDEETGSHSRKTNAGFLDRMLRNVELAPIITVSSGRPVDPLTGLDSNRSLAFPLSSRPLGLGRDTLHTPPMAMVDLRILKAIYFSPQKHLDLVVESFNLLNHTNVNFINPLFGPGSSPVQGFAQPMDAFPARQVEFSIDLEY